MFGELLISQWEMGGDKADVLTVVGNDSEWCHPQTWNSGAIEVVRPTRPCVYMGNDLVDFTVHHCFASKKEDT